VVYQRDSKVKRGKNSFGSKEGLMQTSASGLKSKERGFKIFRGIAQHADRSDARLGFGDFSYLKKGKRITNAAIIIDELQD
jgi:hypothetical protein